MTSEHSIDGKFAQGWGGLAPNGVHVNVLLAARGTPTAAAITTAFTSPSEGFTPVLVSLGETQQSYVTLNPPTVIVSKSAAVPGLPETLIFGAAQVGIAQGVLDTAAAGLVAADQETIILVSLWIDPAAGDETAVKYAAREAAAAALHEAVVGRSAADRELLVSRRDEITHPFYGGD